MSEQQVFALFCSMQPLNLMVMEKRSFYEDTISERVPYWPGITALVNAAIKRAAHPAVMLTRISGTGMCEVSLEIDGKWIVVIRDNGDLISHIVEPSGIEMAIALANRKPA